MKESNSAIDSWRNRAFRWRIGWLAVFAANSVLPILLSRELTPEHGRIGMVVALGLFGVLGFRLVGMGPRIARLLVFGGLITFTPFIWIPWGVMFSGIIGFSAAEFLQGASSSPRPIGEITSEFGGFVATFVTGLVLHASGVLAVGVLWLIGRGFFWLLSAPSTDKRLPLPQARGGVYDHQLDV